MNRKLSLFIASAILLPVLFSTVLSQAKVEKFVMGSGGAVGASNGTSKINYITGQLAIEKRVGTTQVTSNLFQGFWVPNGRGISGVDPIQGTSNEGISNYPNPFTTTTSIIYTLNSPSYVNLKIYDISGKLISNLFEGMQVSGDQKLDWNGSDTFGQNVPTGSYFYELTVKAMNPGSSSSSLDYQLRSVMILVK
ncbi:MAG: T9SS type A sorting domain-containing protein [Candidatus Kapabacteria bacterium]|nr:T9SS type A sorting domain-containing protein [Candidatus Kapabacteria bacterium]